MRRAALVSVISALGAAACATPPVPARIAGMDWSLAQVDGEGAKLAYGRAQSDDVLVMLTCEPRSNRVRVSAPAAAAREDLGLRSGGRAARYAAEAVPAGFGDGVVLESVTTASDPVIASFAASGRLALEVGGRTAPIPAADPAEVRRFIQTCRE